MDRRRAMGLALLVLSLAAGALLVALDPLPEDYEQWTCCGGESGLLMLARGPAIARYDAGTDTTVAVFQCGHAYCDVATQIEGNVTAQVARAQTLLYSPRSPPEGEVDLAEPIAVPPGLAPPGSPPTNITSMTAARFEVGRAWLPLLLYQLAFLGVVLGTLLLLQAPDEAALLGAIGAGLGVFLGAQLVAGGPRIALLPSFVLMLALGLGLVSILGRKRWTRALWAAAFLLAFAAAIAFSMLVAARFFVHPPMD